MLRSSWSPRLHLGLPYHGYTNMAPTVQGTARSPDRHNILMGDQSKLVD